MTESANHSLTYKRLNHFTELLNRFIERDDDNIPVPDNVINSVQKYFIERNIQTANTFNTSRALKDLKMSTYYEHVPRIINRLNIIYNNNNNNSIINDIEQSDQIEQVDEIEQDFECAICFEENIKQITKLNCNHKFCTDCINKFKESIIKCPLCRCQHIMKSNNYDRNNNNNKNFTNIPPKLTNEQINKLKQDFAYVSNKFTEKTANTDRKNMFNYNYVLYKLAEKNNIDLGLDPNEMLLKNYEKLNYHNKMWNKIYPPTINSNSDVDTDTDTDLGYDDNSEPKQEIESEIESEIDSENESKNFTVFNAYKCYKCGENKCVVQEYQSRAADEPISRIITCLVCHNTYRK